GQHFCPDESGSAGCVSAGAEWGSSGAGGGASGYLLPGGHRAANTPCVSHGLQRGCISVSGIRLPVYRADDDDTVKVGVSHRRLNRAGADCDHRAVADANPPVARAGDLAGHRWVVPDDGAGWAAGDSRLSNVNTGDMLTLACALAF